MQRWVTAVLAIEELHPQKYETNELDVLLAVGSCNLRQSCHAREKITEPPKLEDASLKSKKVGLESLIKEASLPSVYASRAQRTHDKRRAGKRAGK